MAKASQPGQKPNEPTPFFKPEVEQALQQKFNSLIAPIDQKYSQVIGTMRDETDQAKFELKFRDSRYADKVSQVEDEARRMQARGQWAPREEILKHMVFAETGKKAQEPAAKAAPAPAKYDNYTGQYVDPATGQFVPPPQYSTVAQGQPPQAEPVVQTPPAQTFQPPPSGYQPQAPPQQWIPQLPQSTPPPQVATGTTNGSQAGLSLTADDKRLESWAGQFGDLPL